MGENSWLLYLKDIYVPELNLCKIFACSFVFERDCRAGCCYIGVSCGVSIDLCLKCILLLCTINY